MPQISKTKDGLKVRWDERDWLQGLGKQWTTSSAEWNKESLLTATNIDPFKYFGQLTSGYNPTDATNMSTMTSLGLNASVNNGGGSSIFAFIITNGDQINRLELASSGNAGTITNNATFPQAISTTKGGGTHAAHTTFVGTDCVIYRHRVGSANATSYFYSWNDNTDGDVGRYDLATTFDSDFMSAVVGGTYSSGAAVLSINPHPMIVGDDDVLYFGDGNFLQYYDGDYNGSSANGTNGTALVLPAGMIINGFSKAQNFLVIYAYFSNGVDASSATYYRGSAKAYFWDYLSLDPSYIYDLEDNYVSAGFTFGNKFGCFTAGRSSEPGVSRTSKLRFFTGTRFKAIKNFNGNPPCVGGVEVHDGMLMWNSSGKIYTFGTPYNNNADVLFQPYGLNSGSSGLLKEFFSAAVFASSGSNATQMQSYYQNFLTGTFSMGAFEPPLDEYRRWKIHKFRVGFGKEFTGGRSLVLYAGLDNQAVTTVATVASAQASAAATNGGLIQDFYNAANGNDFTPFSRMRLAADWDTGSGATDAPVVSYVEMYIEPVN